MCGVLIMVGTTGIISTIPMIRPKYNVMDKWNNCSEFKTVSLFDWAKYYSYCYLVIN